MGAIGIWSIVWLIFPGDKFRVTLPEMPVDVVATVEEDVEVVVPVAADLKVGA